jgi:hypothetical protein
MLTRDQFYNLLQTCVHSCDFEKDSDNKLIKIKLPLDISSIKDLKDFVYDLFGNKRYPEIIRGGNSLNANNLNSFYKFDSKFLSIDEKYFFITEKGELSFNPDWIDDILDALEFILEVKDEIKDLQEFKLFAMAEFARLQYEIDQLKPPVPPTPPDPPPPPPPPPDPSFKPDPLEVLTAYEPHIGINKSEAEFNALIDTMNGLFHMAGKPFIHSQDSGPGPDSTGFTYSARTKDVYEDDSIKVEIEEIAYDSNHLTPKGYKIETFDPALYNGAYIFLMSYIMNGFACKRHYFIIKA